MSELVDKYFKDIRKSKPLTQEQEKAIAIKIQAGDQEALKTLILANTKFVVKIARQYMGRGLELEDLISAGNEGLIKAAEKFKPGEGYRFISYAVFWIRQAIIISLNENREIRLPVNRLGDLNAMRAAREDMAREGIKISDHELAKKTGVALSDIRALDRANRTSVSIDMSIGDEDENTLESIIKNEDADIDSDLKDESLTATIDVVLRRVLTEKETAIIKFSFGIECKELDFEKIGDMYGISGERVRQIREKSLMKLRKTPSVLDALREYL